MAQRSPEAVRSLVIARVKHRLQRHSWPRVHMALIVALTGGFGLLASFVALQLGLDSMALRYPLALATAYLFFLFLVWLWLRSNAEDYSDVPDLSADLPAREPTGCAPEFKSGGGGDFGGGGASGSFDAPAGGVEEAGTASVESAGDAAGALAQADELAIPLIAVALAVGLALASLYVVYIAPVLFAEVLVDGALSYALFRHLRGQDPQHWLASTFRRTALPFLATAVFLTAAGAAMAWYAPGASSVGQVMKHAGTKNPAR
jgi:FtsH-binding integral membrane protein